jgi:hypothetical protein
LPAAKNVNMEIEDFVGIRPQATTDEDTADWEDLLRAVVNYRVFELAIAVELFVATFCKCLITPITNPEPVYSHSRTWQISLFSPFFTTPLYRFELNLEEGFSLNLFRRTST